MVTTLYLIRHCETEGNIAKVFQGSTDGDITERGQKQLGLLAERCRELHFDAIYSSPLKRAVLTAEAANKYHGLPIVKCPEFAEINGGEMEGKKWKDLPLLFPDTYKLWETDFGAFKTEHGETMAQVYERMSEGTMRVLRENQGKSVLIVSHGAALRNLIAFLRGYPLEQLQDSVWVDNTGISCFTFDEQLRPSEQFINDCRHILISEETAPHSMWWRQQTVKK